jgi:NADH dehydrogenase
MTTRILVLGAGYTGMMAALGVARRTRDAQVTVVNPTDRFVERLRLHQVAAGQVLGDHRIPALLAGSGARFVQARATRIDTAARRVTAGDADLAYDVLVYAIGSHTPPVEHAFTITDPGLPDFLRQADGTVTVCGAGLTGIEAATELAEAYPRLHVRLISRGEPGAMMGPAARAHLRRAFDRLAIEVRTGVNVTKVLPDAIDLGGELLPTDGTLWTTGVAYAPLAAEAGITTDTAGRIVVDQYLRSVSHPQIYAVGDAAAIQQSYGVIHGTCQSGIPTAAHAAQSIARQLRGAQPRPFRFGYWHQPVSLGRRDAVVQFTHPDDTPRRWYLRGRAANLYKEAVSSSPLTFYRMPFALPARMLGLTGGRRNRLPFPG